jgi:protease-4
MSQLPPPGQGPIDPQGVFRPPPPPSGAGQGMAPPPQPPPGYPPPMMYPPPPPMWGKPPREGGSFASRFFTTLAMSIFGLSLAANIYLLFSVIALSPTSGVVTQTLVQGDAKQKVVVIPIEGLIMDEQAVLFDRYIAQAEKDANVKAIVLQVNSPGGSVGASDRIHHRILQFRADHADIPIVVSMGDLATSGGYYVSAPADYIFAQPTTLTGNIGVLAQRLNFAELAEKWGIEDTSLHSTGADYKTAGSPLKKETPEERAYIQAIIDEMFAKFKDVVATGRGNRLKAPIQEIANGKAYLTSEALRLGLVDEEGYLDSAWTHAASKAGLTNPTVVRYARQPGLMEALLAKSDLPSFSSDGKRISLEGVGVKLEAEQLYELTRPKLLYLWRGQ